MKIKLAGRFSQRGNLDRTKRNLEIHYAFQLLYAISNSFNAHHPCEQRAMLWHFNQNWILTFSQMYLSSPTYIQQKAVCTSNSFMGDFTNIHTQGHTLMVGYHHSFELWYTHTTSVTFVYVCMYVHFIFVYALQMARHVARCCYYRVCE